MVIPRGLLTVTVRLKFMFNFRTIFYTINEKNPCGKKDWTWLLITLFTYDKGLTSRSSDGNIKTEYIYNASTCDSSAVSVHNQILIAQRFYSVKTTYPKAHYKAMAAQNPPNLKFIMNYRGKFGKFLLRLKLHMHAHIQQPLHPSRLQ